MLYFKGEFKVVAYCDTSFKISLKALVDILLAGEVGVHGIEQNSSWTKFEIQKTFIQSNPQHKGIMYTRAS